MTLWQRLATTVAADGVAALVSVTGVAGSTPREAGARMVVTPEGGLAGTIGGGALEFAMVARALALLMKKRRCAEMLSQALGPDLGQCCGGQAIVRIEVFDKADLDWIGPLALAEAAGGVLRTLGDEDEHGRIRRTIAGPGQVAEQFGFDATPLLLFGAGHVGRALVLALAPLPFSIDWIDTRAEAFPAHVPANVRPRLLADPPAVLAGARAGTLVAVMTHSHPLDLAIVAAALADPRFVYVGLIGSDSKRARFVSRLQGVGLAEAAASRLICPVGGRRLSDKAPPVIAAAVAVELLDARQRIDSGAQPLAR